MSLDEEIDVPMAALLALVVPALNEELKISSLNLDCAVKQGATYPLMYDQGLNVPALSMYRLRERHEQITMHKSAEVITVQFEYSLGPVVSSKQQFRWAILQRVWHELVAVICRGAHPVVADDAQVLSAAGWVDIDPAQTRVQYGYHPQGKSVIPRFLGQMELTARAPDDLSVFPDLVELHIDYLLPGAEDPAVKPINERLLVDADLNPP